MDHFHPYWQLVSKNVLFQPSKQLLHVVKRLRQNRSKKIEKKDFYSFHPHFSLIHVEFFQNSQDKRLFNSISCHFLLLFFPLFTCNDEHKKLYKILIENLFKHFKAAIGRCSYKNVLQTISNSGNQSCSKLYLLA